MNEDRYRALTPDEEWVILHKGTEAPYSGEYENHFEQGIYHCKQCHAALYKSRDKFHSGCGWPSFDDEIEGAVKRVPDADGRRVEIICNTCGGHLGHIFEGEGFTPKNSRHCVNSLSILFEPYEEGDTLKKAYFAAGCFWGVEHLFKQLKGVITVKSGYMGGHKDNPTYKEVCYTDTGHLEAVEVLYDPSLVSYERLVQFFFEIHDPTQKNGQGPDIGPQYHSALFTSDESERKTIHGILSLLKDRGLDIATEVKEEAPFWPAEEYHQNYYAKTGKQPYCHIYTKRF